MDTMALLTAKDFIGKAEGLKTELDVMRFFKKHGVKHADGGITTEELFTQALLHKEAEILVTQQKVEGLTGKSRSFISNERKAGRFPQPVDFIEGQSQRNYKWRKTDVLEWLNGRRKWGNEAA